MPPWCAARFSRCTIQSNDPAWEYIGENELFNMFILFEINGFGYFYFM